jgi:hypothetical protein
MKTKFAIGCFVQWYEVDMIHEYFNSLLSAIDYYDKSSVIIDVTVCNDTTLEQPISNVDEISHPINDQIHSIWGKDYNIKWRTKESLYTIADYRREFNINYCDTVDVLIWGESDMLVPKQMFMALDLLHQQQSSITPKYISTFAICKMWDSSWQPLEHPEFTTKPFIEGDDKNWWNIPYTMSELEMNSFNDRVDDLDIKLIHPHKFNGCGLVISSEVIKSGVNIPKSSFFIHEDTSFMIMMHKLLGDVPQYHFANILMVHNRKHVNKRKYVNGESDTDYIDTKRKRFEWYNIANKMCEQNNANLFNIHYKSFTWEDVWNNIK